MRYADTPSVSVSVEIAAPPDRVWELITDIELPARFSTEFEGAEWLEGDEPGPGARFVGRNRRKDRSWETISTVDVYEPGRSFGWAVMDPADPAATWRFDLEEIAGGTRLTQSARMGPGPSGVSYLVAKYPDREEAIVAGRLAEWHTNMEATVAGIKQLAEAGGG